MRRRLLLLVSAVATFCLLISTVANASAAQAAPVVTVSIINKDIALVVGRNFTPGASVKVVVTTGTLKQQTTALVAADHRFAAGTFVPATYAGNVLATATAGTQTASGGIKILSTSAKAPAKIPTAIKSTPAPAARSAHTLGVGGVKPAAGAILSSADTTADLEIKEGGTATKPKIYDGQGHTVGTINVSASYVTVQNFKISASGQYGAELRGEHITFQNNDIKNVHPSGDGDLNAITFFGNNINIIYNTAVDFVSGDPGGSHTDAIQTWDSNSETSSSNVLIGWNKFSGPDKSAGAPIHQCIMAEGPASTDGGGGGPGQSTNWLVIGNYFKDSWNQCLKFDDIDNVTVTKNQFDGNSSAVVDATDLSSGFKFYSDNKITGQYSSKPDITASAGPTSLPAA